MNNKGKISKELKVKSSTDNLGHIRNFVKESAQTAGISEAVAGKVILAVDEACTNIIKHAYKYSPKGDIFIKIRTDKSKFIITIVDEGDHFDPNNVPEPNLPKLQKERKSGGLGMFLMKKLMDEVKYTNLSSNKNQVVLVKYLN